MRNLIKIIPVVMSLSVYTGNAYASASVGYPDTPSSNESLGGHNLGASNSSNQKYLNYLHEQTRATKLLLKKLHLKSFWHMDVEKRQIISNKIDSIVNQAMLDTNNQKEFHKMVDERIDLYAKVLQNLAPPARYTSL
jgi:hypothetical protein